jgi:hypothetical protein
VAAVKIFIEETALQLINEVKREYDKKGVQVLLSLFGCFDTRNGSRSPLSTRDATPDFDSSLLNSPARSEGAESSNESFHTPPQTPRPLKQALKKRLTKELGKLMQSRWKDEETNVKRSKLRSGRL